MSSLVIFRSADGPASPAATSAAARAGAAHPTPVAIRPGGKSATAVCSEAAPAADIEPLRRLGNHGATATTAPARGDRRPPLRASGLCRAGGDGAALRAAIGLGANLPAITGTGGDALTGAGFRIARLGRCPLL